MPGQSSPQNDLFLSLSNAPPQLSAPDRQFWLERVYAQVRGLPRLAPLLRETPFQWITRAAEQLSPALEEIRLVLTCGESSGQDEVLHLEARDSSEIRRLELGPWYARLEAHSPALAAGALRELSRVWPFGMWTPIESWAHLQNGYWRGVDEHRELKLEFPNGEPGSAAKKARYAKLLQEASQGYTYAEAALELPSHLSGREGFKPGALPGRDTLESWCTVPLFRLQGEALFEHLSLTLKALSALEAAQKELGVDPERGDVMHPWSGDWYHPYGTLAHLASPPYGLHREIYDEYHQYSDFSESEPLLYRALEGSGDLFEMLCQCQYLARLMTWLEQHLQEIEEIAMQTDHVAPPLPTLLECQRDLEARAREGNQISSEELLEWWRTQTGPSHRPSENQTLGVIHGLMTQTGVPLESFSLGLL